MRSRAAVAQPLGIGNREGKGRRDDDVPDEQLTEDEGDQAATPSRQKRGENDAKEVQGIGSRSLVIGAKARRTASISAALARPTPISTNGAGILPASRSGSRDLKMRLMLHPPLEEIG